MPVGETIHNPLQLMFMTTIGVGATGIIIGMETIGAGTIGMVRLGDWVGTVGIQVGVIMVITIGMDKVGVIMVTTTGMVITTTIIQEEDGVLIIALITETV
jgi:hypothetical protein